MLAAILAHQGGWDEMLMVIAPVGLFWLILRRANQRAERMAGEATPPEAAADASVEGGDVGTE